MEAVLPAIVIPVATFLIDTIFGRRKNPAMAAIEKQLKEERAAREKAEQKRKEAERLVGEAEAAAQKARAEAEKKRKEAEKLVREAEATAQKARAEAEEAQAKWR